MPLSDDNISSVIEACIANDNSPPTALCRRGDDWTATCSVILYLASDGPVPPGPRLASYRNSAKKNLLSDGLAPPEARLASYRDSAKKNLLSDGLAPPEARLASYRDSAKKNLLSDGLVPSGARLISW